MLNVFKITDTSQALSLLAFTVKFSASEILKLIFLFYLILQRVGHIVVLLLYFNVNTIQTGISLSMRK